MQVTDPTTELPPRCSRAPVRWHVIVGLAVALTGSIIVGMGIDATPSAAQSSTEVQDVPRRLGSLKTVKVQLPANLSDFVQDQSTAAALGKAFFWDQQMGSDGVTACATCHYQAGADVRTKNTISPGVLGGSLAWSGKGPNYQLTPQDYPFHHLVDPDNATSPVLADVNDVTGAQGVFDTSFNIPGIPGALTKGVDSCTQATDGVFTVGGVNTRRVTGRNAPSVIDAALNFRNFWDGRANNNFNGVNPFGDRDPKAVIFKNVSGATTPQAVHVSIPLSSLASQAVGPPGSAFEMSCGGRIFPNMGRKMLTTVPLGQQLVDPSDSLLGPLANSRKKAGAKGLDAPYISMIQKAFRPEYWNSSAPITIGSSSPITPSLLMSDLIKIIAPNKVVPLTAATQGKDQVMIPTNKYAQIEANFSLFWGLAIQLYEDTLIADDSPVDRFFDGNKTALNADQLDGLAVFENDGRCINCHGGAETTNASVPKVTSARLERMKMGDSGVAVYDDGFYNIGVRPTSEDVGLAGNDPFGAPLSETVSCQLKLKAGGACDPAVQNIIGRPNEFIAPAPLGANDRSAVRGNFKVPGLRNVELNGPYFHNGGEASLRDVVDFYNRGGNFADENSGDLDTEIAPIGLTPDQKDHLVSFLTGLTDERVRWERAPFDHPALCMPNGHPGDSTSVTADSAHAGPPAQATDTTLCLPATGAGGRTTSQGALKPFLGLDPHAPAPVYTGAVAEGTDPNAVSSQIIGDPHGTTGELFAPPPPLGAAPPATIAAWGETAPSGLVMINGHLWTSDHVQGLCRLDPTPNSAPPDVYYTVNTDTCDPNGTIGSPGQPTYDPTANSDGTHFVYVPDNSHKSPGVWRLTYHPDLDRIDNPVLMDPGAGLAGIGADATALGPDGNLYVGSLKNGGIRRINAPRSDPRQQTMDIIGQTTDGRGINGSMAFAGSDLYLPENRGLTFIANAPGCAAFGCGPTLVSLPNVATVNSVASDGADTVYVATLPPPPPGTPAGRGGAVLLPTTVMRYNPSSGNAVSYETQGAIPPAGSPKLTEFCFEGASPEGCTRQADPWTTPGSPVGLFFVLGMYVDPGTGALYIADDPLAGKRFGSGHIWMVP